MADGPKQTVDDDVDVTSGARVAVPVVGIGASAGGLEALEAFFAHVPPEPGLAFVVVQHLAPEHPSLMPDLLAKRTTLPVALAEDGAPVVPNHVYVIPPNASLTIAMGVLCVKTPIEPRRTPIDVFLRSLAEDQGDNAIGIILSGTGSDGSLGLKAVREHGGLTMAQAPESAKYDSMPRSALGLGVVDTALRPEEMPAKLVDYVTYLARATHAAPREPQDDVNEMLRKICAILQHRTGHDFGRYKPATLVRRIQRRRQVRQSPTLGEYVEMLRRDPLEVDLLFRDLLIGVTHFFRDPEAFDAFATRVIPEMLADKGIGGQVRVWVPGCASGEEAYSIAMLLREAFSRLDVVPQVKIFATDIDERALETARAGRYPEGIAEHVSQERLERFFLKQGGTYQVDKQLREMCIFSTHNMIGDPPFSRLDLISCRNLLIYLESDVQRKLVPLFHYALRRGGHLFLGPSESLAGYPELFRVVDKKNRIFRRNDTVVAPAVTFPVTDAPRGARLSPEPLARGIAARDLGLAKVLERVLLDTYAPATVIVNERSEIVFISGRTAKYLELPPGATSVNVIDMARKSLRPDLHTAVHRAVKTRQEVVHENVTVDVGAALQRITLIVRPMPDVEPESGLFMIVFLEVGPPIGHGQAEAVELEQRGRDPLAQALEAELRSTKEHLQTTIEELETSNEELKSANEEMLSTNEELQSTNEELQTSKEELQSINEELQTVNLELNRKLDELDRVNSDLQNLFASTHIATVFLDSDLRIKKFSTAATEIFRLIETDVGRPITDIAPILADASMLADVRNVLATLVPQDRQVRSLDGKSWFIRRIRPYRSLDNVIDGVVITFVDITDLKRAQERASELAAIVESSSDAIFGMTFEGVITSWNLGAERLFGYSAADATGQPSSILAPEADPFQPGIERVRRGETVPPFQATLRGRGGAPVAALVTLSKVIGPEGIASSVACIAHDVTERARIERERIEILARLGAEQARLTTLVTHAPCGIVLADAQGNVVVSNPMALSLVPSLSVPHDGHPERTDLFHEDGRMIGPEDTPLARALRGETVQGEDYLSQRADGRRTWIRIGAGPIHDPAGGITGVVFVVFDVDAERRAMEAVRQSEERLRLAIEVTNLGTWELDPRTNTALVSDGAKAILGLRGNGSIDYEALRSAIHPDDRERHDTAMRQALDPRGSGEYQLELRLLSPDGAIRWVASRGKAFFGQADGSRTIERFVATVLDITERKRVEVALTEGDRRKNEFLAMLGHELRNPLVPIRNAVHVIRSAGIEKLDQVVDMADRQVTHMTRLIDDLLDVSRIASGKVVLREEPIDLVEIVRSVVMDHGPSAAAAHVSLQATLPQRALRAFGDPTRLSQAIGNVVQNAIKFTSAGGHIDVGIEVEGEHATIRVRDDGVGMDREALSSVFQPFVQSEQGRARGGLGLGLALSKGMVELHGGTISAASEGRGCGATLSIRLPLRESPAPAIARVEPEPEHAATVRPRRVLLIEDNADVAESIRMVFELAGHTVAVAATGAEGVAAAHQLDPEIVLCDIGLEGDMDGHDVARALRDDPKVSHAYRIAMSGYGQPEDQRRAKDAGFDQHLTKPVEPSKLLSLVASVPLRP